MPGEIPDREEDPIQVEQPCWETIKRLQRGSEFKRSDETLPNCTIECEGKRYTIEVIENGEDPALADVQKLFEDTFGQEEVDPEKILRSAVNGITSWGTPEEKYRIVTVRNEKGELASTFAGAQLELLNEQGQPTGEAAYFVGYAVTNPKLRQKGLAKEAYISALIDAQKEAQNGGRKLKFAIGECTYTSEKFWNSVGWKRVYSKEEGNQYRELEYIQPALDFDEDTGEMAEGAGEAPEHLMVDNFGEGAPNKEEIRQSYMAFMDYNLTWPEGAFNNPEAYGRQRQYVDGITSRFVDSLKSGGDLVFLSAKERVTVKKGGTKILEHNGANHGEAGKEDF